MSRSRFCFYSLLGILDSGGAPEGLNARCCTTRLAQQSNVSSRWCGWLTDLIWNMAVQTDQTDSTSKKLTRSSTHASHFALPSALSALQSVAKPLPTLLFLHASSTRQPELCDEFWLECKLKSVVEPGLVITRFSKAKLEAVVFRERKAAGISCWKTGCAGLDLID